MKFNWIKSKPLFIFAIFIIWGFLFQTVWVYLNTDLEGTIVSSRDVPSTGAPRYATDYIVHGLDGHEKTYVAGSTDASLPRSMPVGTRIHKQRWLMGYERDGQWINFPMLFYSIILAAAFACLFWSIFK